MTVSRGLNHHLHVTDGTPCEGHSAGRAASSRCCPPGDADPRLGEARGPGDRAGGRAGLAGSASRAPVPTRPAEPHPPTSRRSPRGDRLCLSRGQGARAQGPGSRAASRPLIGHLLGIFHPNLPACQQAYLTRPQSDGGTSLAGLGGPPGGLGPAVSSHLGPRPGSASRPAFVTFPAQVRGAVEGSAAVLPPTPQSPVPPPRLKTF